MDSTRKSKVGTIEVVRHGATFLRSEYTTPTPTSVDFDQANKKDAHGITGGRYTMSTTKKGRLLTSKSGGAELRSIWSIGGELGRLSVEYHMGHSLQVRYKHIGSQVSSARVAFLFQEINYSASSVCPLWGREQGMAYLPNSLANLKCNSSPCPLPLSQTFANSRGVVYYL